MVLSRYLAVNLHYGALKWSPLACEWHYSVESGSVLAWGAQEYDNRRVEFPQASSIAEGFLRQPHPTARTGLLQESFT